MTAPSAEREIEELNKQLAELKVEKEKFGEESFRWASKRDVMHGEIKGFRLESRAFKEKRDAINSEIQKLKAFREEARAKYREKIDNLKQIRSRLSENLKGAKRRTMLDLEKEIESIDWKIQTNSLSLDEEKKLVAQVKLLENQLKDRRKLETANNEINQLEIEAKTLKAKIVSHTSKISDLAEQSQKFHEKMIGLIENIKVMQSEADEMHKKFVDSREKSNVLEASFDEIFSKIKSLRRSISEKEEETKAKKIAELQIKLEEEALEKLKQGKKLTFDEFKILAEKGKI